MDEFMKLWENKPDKEEDPNIDFEFDCCGFGCIKKVKLFGNETEENQMFKLPENLIKSKKEAKLAKFKDLD
jgi:hypothetical protein